MDSLGITQKLETEKKLSNIEKILSVTNGSVTQILEVLTGKQVNIKTISQEIKDAGKMAVPLGVGRKEEVNFRRVQILDNNGKILVNARSWIPLSRLEPAFYEDLLKADVPIGKLLIKHRIEARRELVDAKILDGRIVRTYDLIRFGKILMRIEERFEDLSDLI